MEKTEPAQRKPGMLNASCWAVLALVWIAPAAAAEWSGYASLGTDYIYRGVSLLDSGPGLQAGVEDRFAEHFIIGTTAAKIDRQWAYQQYVSNHLQLDFYAGADFACGAHCRTRMLVSHYAFPGSDTRDWSEVTGAVSFFDRYGASLSWSPHGLGSPESTRSFESWLQQPLSRSTSFELGYGKVLIGDLDYWYAHVGISRRIDRFVVDLTAHWSDRGLDRFAFDERNRHLVFTISTGF
jgi:uncharacterized protein (TIGR02001 family)